MTLKICTKCGMGKPVDSFSRCSRQLSGLDPWCRDCRSTLSRKNYVQNRAARIARARLWQEQNPERYKELRTQASAKNKISNDEWLVRKAATKERSRQSSKDSQKARYHADPQYRIQKRAAEYQRRDRLKADRLAADLARDINELQTSPIIVKRAHRKLCPLLSHFPDLQLAAKQEMTRQRHLRRSREKQRENVRRWKRAHPGAVSRQRHRRRQTLATAINDLTTAQWLAIKAAYGQRCAYCGEKRRLTQDHVIPVSKGGNHTASNIVPACQSCNSSKGARPPQRVFQAHLIT